MPNIDLLTLLADDKTEVRYRPRWNSITGGICGSILLKQIIDLWVENRRAPFVKFNSPCQHPSYKPGESWQEELGMSRREFESARDGIAVRTKRGIIVADALVSYWVDVTHTPRYALNESLLLEKLATLYPASNGPGIQPQLPNVQNVHQLMYETHIRANAQNVHQGFPNVQSEHQEAPNVQNGHQQTTSGKSVNPLPDVRNEHQIIVVEDHDPDHKEVTTTDAHAHTHEVDRQVVHACLDWIGFVGVASEEPLTAVTALAWAWWVRLNEKRLRKQGKDPVGIAVYNWRKPVNVSSGISRLAQTWLGMTEEEQTTLLQQTCSYRHSGGMYLPEGLLHLEIDPQLFKELYGATDGRPVPDCLMPRDEPDEPNQVPDLPISDEAATSCPVVGTGLDITGPGGLTAEVAYKALLGELALQMTKSTFNTWLKDAKLLSVIPEGEAMQFRMGVCNDYAADWIENRLKQTVVNNLRPIWGGDVTLAIDVWSDELVGPKRNGHARV